LVERETEIERAITFSPVNYTYSSTVLGQRETEIERAITFSLVNYTVL
jgi:hypothetical protein